MEGRPSSGSRGIPPLDFTRLRERDRTGAPAHQRVKTAPPELHLPHDLSLDGRLHEGTKQANGWSQLGTPLPCRDGELELVDAITLSSNGSSSSTDECARHMTTGGFDGLELRPPPPPVPQWEDIGTVVSTLSGSGSASLVTAKSQVTKDTESRESEVPTPDRDSARDLGQSLAASPRRNGSRDDAQQDDQTIDTTSLLPNSKQSDGSGPSTSALAKEAYKKASAASATLMRQATERSAAVKAAYKAAAARHGGREKEQSSYAPLRGAADVKERSRATPLPKVPPFASNRVASEISPALKKQKRADSTAQRQFGADDMVRFTASGGKLVVVDANSTFQRMLLGSDERNQALNRFMKQYYIHVLFMLVGYMAIACSLFAYSQNWSWYPYRAAAFAGLPMWLQMLGTRHPGILWRCMKRFDFVFMTGNFLVLSASLCVEFRWDDRALVLMMVVFPASWVSLTVDASAARFENAIRSVTYCVGLLLTLYVIVMASGGLFEDTDDLNIYFHSATFEITLDHNTTAHDSQGGPWDATMVFNFRDVGVGRGLYFAVFSGVLVWRACLYKTQTSWLSVSATKSMHDEAGADSEAKQEEREDAPEIEVDPDSERVLNGLDDDAHVVVLAPVHEFMVPNGVADTLLAQMFTSDVDEAAEFMDWFDQWKLQGAVLYPVFFIVGLLAALEIIPPSFTWLPALNMYHIARTTLKLNIHAIKKCLLNVTGFWVPLVAVTFGCWYCVASLVGNNGARCYAICLCIFFVSALLQNDCDLRRKRIVAAQHNRSTAIFQFATGLYCTVVVACFVLGGIPSAQNMTHTVTFFERDISVGTFSMISRFISTALLYTMLYAWKAWRDPTRCSVIKIPTAKRVMRKRELPRFIEDYKAERARVFDPNTVHSGRALERCSASVFDDDHFASLPRRSASVLDDVAEVSGRTISLGEETEHANESGVKKPSSRRSSVLETRELRAVGPPTATEVGVP